MHTNGDKNRALFINCQAGIAGDMFLASLIEIAAGEDYLRAELAKLQLPGYSILIFSDMRGGLSGTRFDVKADESHVHRHLSDIRRIISKSGLSEKVQIATMRAFTLLAEAEAKVHGTGIDEVHFHEVGAVDSIIDITGAMIMLDYLGWPEVVFTPLNVGSGTLECAHGVLPIPAPATAELLQGVSVYSRGEPMERVTPTGAVLVRALGASISLSQPSGKIVKIGNGLGAKNSALPNVLRAILIERESAASYNMETFAELCANIDDMSPEDLSAVMERLFEDGALDVWYEPIQMKKNRPAVKLCCLAVLSHRDRLAEIILRETTSLGVRIHAGERYVLDRRIDTFDTPLGALRVKSAIAQGRVVKQMPEFDDILKLSKKHGIPVMKIREILAMQEFVPQLKDESGKQKADNSHGRCHVHGHDNGYHDD